MIPKVDIFLLQVGVLQDGNSVIALYRLDHCADALVRVFYIERYV